MTRRIRTAHSWVASVTIPLHPSVAADAMSTGKVTIPSGSDGVTLPVMEVWCSKCRRSRDRVQTAVVDGRVVDEPCVIDGVQQGGPRRGIQDHVGLTANTVNY